MWSRWLDVDEDFRRWHSNLARGSLYTANERARVLYRFLSFYGLTPRQLVELAKRDRRRVEDMLSDFVDGLLRRGRSPGYVVNYVKAVRSWLEYNEVRLYRRVKVGNTNYTPTIESERVPTPAELATILCYASDRARCSIAFMAFAGLRPETLGNIDGSDGLMIRDLPELRVEGKNIIFERVPTMAVVRPSLSKARHRYFTFLTSEGCDYLKAYLEKRIASGEELTPESPVIAVKAGFENHGGRQSIKFVTTKTITAEIRRAIRPRFRWRPYVLRAYFDTQLMVAETHGRISHAYRQFFMGHKGDIEARYTTNKGRLPPDLIEDMRRSFAACERYLSTRQAREDPEIATIRTMVESGVLDLSNPKVRQYLLRKLGVEDAEAKLARMKEGGLSQEEAEATLIFKELGVQPLKIEPANKKDPKKIICEEELESYLAEGWEVQTILPSGKNTHKERASLTPSYSHT